MPANEENIYIEPAPAKLNLCLYVGPKRTDDLHEICSLFESLELADTVTAKINPTLADDAVTCSGPWADHIDGENLVTRALQACRNAGILNCPHLEITIDKQIPVAAGLGGGSADAAAALRIVAAVETVPLANLAEIARNLGADVTSQLQPGRYLVGGVGEHLTPVSDQTTFHYVLVPDRQGLSTADVYNTTDAIGATAPNFQTDREQLFDAVREHGLSQSMQAWRNDLAGAITKLRPELTHVLESLSATGAQFSAFTGSGPTGFGVFETAPGATDAADALRRAGRDPIVTQSARRQYS